MAEGDPGDTEGDPADPEGGSEYGEHGPGESFEERLRGFARDLSQSFENAARELNLDAVADQIEMGGARLRDMAEAAGEWLAEQFGDDAARAAAGARRRLRIAGPHPLDPPSEEQALALSALASGRWKVKPGTEELITDENEPAPDAPPGLVGELRARDWIAASGELTPLGQDALKRWSQSAGGG
jgi:hypothetical protein